MTLESIRRRLEAATPGPWKATVVSGDSAYYSNPSSNIHLNDMVAWPVGPMSKSQAMASRDAELIAHAPTDIARLLAFVEPIAELITMFRGEGVNLGVSDYGPKLVAAYEALERGEDE